MCLACPTCLLVRDGPCIGWKLSVYCVTRSRRLWWHEIQLFSHTLTSIIGLKYKLRYFNILPIHGFCILDSTCCWETVFSANRMECEWTRYLQLFVSVELQEACDRARGEKLWCCERKSGVAEKCVRMVQGMYEDSETGILSKPLLGYSDGGQVNRWGQAG